MLLVVATQYRGRACELYIFRCPARLQLTLETVPDALSLLSLLANRIEASVHRHAAEMLTICNKVQTLSFANRNAASG